MKHKGLLLILIAVVLGLGTFVSIFIYTSKLEEKVTVVVAVEDIPPHTEITEELVVVQERNKLNIPEGAAPNIKVLEGIYSGPYGIYKDDIVTREKVQNKDEMADHLLSNNIPPGKVAVAMDVDLVRSVAGVVQNGDFVDISVINEQFEVTPIQSIKTLGVKDKDGNDMNRSKMENPVPAVVIFEATPAERDVLMKITERGKVHLSLLNPNEVTETRINEGAVRQLENYTRQQYIPEGEPSNETAPNTNF